MNTKQLRQHVKDHPEIQWLLHNKKTGDVTVPCNGQHFLDDEFKIREYTMSCDGMCLAEREDYEPLFLED